jgi:tetratricopeptide (TPR) repeat protein
VSERFDVFISYAHADAEWVGVLADNLHRLGLDVFQDRWEIRPGDIVVRRLEEGIRSSANGVLVVSPASLASKWVQQEYAAMLVRVVDGKQRLLIPVLYADVDEVPPFLAARLWIDFRDAEGPVYEKRVRQLADALRDEKPARTERDGVIQPPPGEGVRPAVFMRRSLVISTDQVSLRGGPEEISHQPAGLQHSTGQAIWQLHRARRRRGSEQPMRAAPAPAINPAETPLHAAQLAVGAALTRDLLDGEAGHGLVRAVVAAESQGVALELGLQVVEELADLPWETLRLPTTGDAAVSGPPLALHPNVQLFRAPATEDPAPAITIPGPLRILVAIGSPEEQNRRGELLDMELELKLILDAVEPARRKGGAVVRVLQRGTAAAIREALEGERYHVLHISCHARPGELVLEDTNGARDMVSAERLCNDGLPAGRQPSLVVLAGCGTALTGQAEEEKEPLPALARSLLARGIPAVVAMQGPVSDRYASQLGASFYHDLATMEQPQPLLALCRARRRLEQERCDGSGLPVELAEWATPTLHLRGPSIPLYDPTVPCEPVKPLPEPSLADGVVVRRVGEMVGRRREQRLLLQAIHDQDSAGMLVHGLGGVGKSTIAADAAYLLAEEGWLVVSRAGQLAPEDLLAEVGTRLLAVAHAGQLDEQHPLRQIAIVMRRPDVEWNDRFQVLAEHLLGQIPLLVLLDNFEDNLTEPDADGNRSCANQQLAKLLSTWLKQPKRSRMLVTCRYPFLLPDQSQRRLQRLHLGPLTIAETRKLVWRLPGLDRLDPEEQLRAYTDVGGHPRALEYLDALLRGGEARFDDVAMRMEKAIEKRSGDKPQRWLKSIEGDLDRALAESVTLAADDVLLDGLLKSLADQPMAQDLLIGAAVYRVPIDQIGLAWQVSEEIEPKKEPKLEQRWQQFQEAAQEARKAGKQPSLEQAGITAEEYAEVMTYRMRPPLAVPQGLNEARDRLLELGLLAPTGSDEERRFSVHRWTATALAQRTNEKTSQQSHQRAARFWRWREDYVPQSREQDIEQLIEARYHHHVAGDIDEAVHVTESVCLQLDTWGAYRREQQLCHEVLTWVPERSRHAAAFSHQLGVVAQNRGDYDDALLWYRRSLEIEEELGNRAGMADSYHQLGNVSYLRGDYDGALLWYRRSLEIKEELGNRAGMANSYGQFGNLAMERGDYDDSLQWYRKALEIFEELGNRAGMANSYHQLGNLAMERGDYDDALLWYRRSLEIKEELGNRAGMANSTSQIGVLLTEQGDPEAAVPLSLRGLAIQLEIGSPEAQINLHWLRRQRELLDPDRFAEIVKANTSDEAAAGIFKLLDSE